MYAPRLRGRIRPGAPRAKLPARDVAIADVVLRALGFHLDDDAAILPPAVFDQPPELDPQLP
eukprot:4080825-Pyramimonas_sp.AAC.1